MGCAASVPVARGQGKGIQPRATTETQANTEATISHAAGDAHATNHRRAHVSFFPTNHVQEVEDIDDSDVHDLRDPSNLAWGLARPSIDGRGPEPDSLQGSATNITAALTGLTGWKSAKNLIKSEKSYVPLDDLYAFQSALGDLPSNMEDLFDAEESRLLKEAKALGLDYHNPEHVKQILCSAVNLTLLCDFASKVNDDKITTYAVVETIIKPSSKERECSYAELLEAEQVGQPHYFVSHSWGGNFMDMVRRIKSELKDENPENVYLWIDMFSLNLHHKDRTAFKRVQDAMLVSKRGTLAVLEPSATMVSCCLYEIWATVHYRGLHLLKFVANNPAAPVEWDAAVRELDLFACKPTKQRDRGAALKAVTDGPGVEVVNEQLQVLLTLDPPNIPNVELEANGEWSQYVILDTMDEWLNLPDRNGKMLWIRGPSGTGKSTVYAAVLERAGMGRLSDPLSERYQLKKSRYNGAAVIFHAVRHNDLKTRSPLRIVHSLAWQLYKAFPDEVGEYYTNMGPEDVRQLTDVTEAVKVLLREPIKKHLASHSVLILMDGLDEGTGDVCSLTTAGMSNYDDQMLTDINLCWENPVLRFVTIHLRTLPHNVKLLVTSRSNSVPGGEPDYLEHMLESFGVHSMTVEPVDMFFVRERGYKPDLSGSGPLRHLSAKMRSSMSVNSNLNQAYSAKNPWNQSFPTMVFARVVKSIESMGGTETVPTEVAEAIKLCLHMHTKRTLSVNGTARLVRMFEVLAALREPPTLSKLRSWGFKDAKRLVKACGFMLHITETTEVHAFHKLLFKFLADRRQAGEFSASPRSGHRSLARMLLANIQNENAPTTEYALRNVMLHAHLADDNVAIDTLAGSVDFWQQCFKAGIGHLVYQDLLRFGRMTDILKDTVLFLSAHHHEFMQSPELVVQRAYDTPKSSIFSRQLRKAGVKVPGRVLSKPSGWSAEQFSIGNLEGVLWCVAISPDGMILALGTGDHKVLLCEARSGIQLAALEGHTEAVMHVTYSHDGRRLASGSCDGTARLWDAGGGVRIATLRGHNGPVTSCSFSPSGRFLATGGVDCTVRVWDIEEESDCLQVAELKGHSKWVATVAYGPYGNVIVSGGNDGRVVVWDAATWVLRSTIDNISHAVYSLALTPDESTVAIGCEDGVLRLWSLISMKQVREVEAHRDRIECVVFSHDASIIATSSRDAKICIFATATGTLVSSLDGHRGAVHHIAFSPDNTRVYSGSADKTARVWGMPPAQEGGRRPVHQRLEHHFGSVRSLAFGPSNSILASASEDCLVKVWDADKEELVSCGEGHQGPVVCVAVSPDGSLLASGSMHTVRIWDTENCQERGVFEGHDTRIYDVAFSPDGSLVASASYDMTVALWDPHTGIEAGRLRGHGGSVTCVAFSCDGRQAVTGSVDRTLKLWDLATFGEIASIPDHAGHVNCVASSPDGKLFCSGSHLGLVQLWKFDGLERGLTLRPASEERQRTEKQEGTARLQIENVESIFQTHCVAFSCDGRLLGAGMEDMVVRVWQVATGKEVASFTGHKGAIRSVAFSPDGRLLASGSDDMFVRIWDVGHL